MKKLSLFIYLISALSLTAQTFKDRQILKFDDPSKKMVVIDEFLVYDKASKTYKPYKIPYADFYDYKKNPLGIRYFNFGCIKTKRSGFWLGQIDKDKFGHAIFSEPIYGIRTMILMNAEIIENRGKNTLLKFFNVYAPSNDCVGSIKGEDGKCLYGYNKPEKYAKKVGDVIGLGINDSIKLRNEAGELDLRLMTLLLSEVAKFETGKTSKFEESTIKKALELN